MNTLQVFNSLSQNLTSALAKDYSRFLIVSDGAGWVLDEEGKEIIKVARELGIEGRFIFKPLPNIKQCVHYNSQFSLMNSRVFKTKHRISVDYFHGKPDQGKDFAQVYENIKNYHSRLSKVRVSYSEMEKLVLSTNIDPSKIIRISIGINPSHFSFQTKESKIKMRDELGIPQSALVIGSFQKDGSGWGEGLEPKLVKGPDVFLKTLEILKTKIPDIYVLLTGPSRGFVKRGLEQLKIPYQHFLLKNYFEIGRYYSALDAYIVSSREEGGPKAILESMISGVPIVSTKVGQAIDIIQDSVNGYLSEIADPESLAHKALTYISMNEAQKSMILHKAYDTAINHSYAAQKPLWKQFFKNYVDGIK